MYNNNIYVTLFFAFMWLAVVGGSVTSTQGVTLIPLGPTNYCTNGKLDAYVIASGVIPFVNDTLVFVAITWRLIHGSPNAGLSARTGGMWSFFFGKHLPAFSRGLLKDGQVYYLLSGFHPINTYDNACYIDFQFILLQKHSWSLSHVSDFLQHQIRPCCLSFSDWDPGYHVDQRHGLSRVSKYKVWYIQRADW